MNFIRILVPLSKRERYAMALYGTHCVQAERWEEELYGTHCVWKNDFFMFFQKNA